MNARDAKRAALTVVVDMLRDEIASPTGYSWELVPDGNEAAHEKISAALEALYDATVYRLDKLGGRVDDNP